MRPVGRVLPESGDRGGDGAEVDVDRKLRPGDPSWPEPPTVAGPRGRARARQCGGRVPAQRPVGTATPDQPEDRPGATGRPALPLRHDRTTDHEPQHPPLPPRASRSAWGDSSFHARPIRRRNLPGSASRTPGCEPLPDLAGPRPRQPDRWTSGRWVLFAHPTRAPGVAAARTLPARRRRPPGGAILSGPPRGGRRGGRRRVFRAAREAPGLGAPDEPYVVALDPAGTGAAFRSRRKRKNSAPSRSRRRITAGSRSMPPTIATILRGRK